MDLDRKKNFSEPMITEEASLAEVTLTSGQVSLGWLDVSMDV